MFYKYISLMESLNFDYTFQFKATVPVKKKQLISRFSEDTKLFFLGERTVNFSFH